MASRAHSIEVPRSEPEGGVRARTERRAIDVDAAPLAASLEAAASSQRSLATASAAEHAIAAWTV
jgi:hypothetical protein